MKQGFVLATVLLVAALLASSAILLYAMATTDMQITHNVRLHTRAKNTASSGLVHFKALSLHYEDLERMEENQGEEFLVLEGFTAAEDRYRVTVVLSEDEVFYVYSTGTHERGGQVVASAQLAASFQSLWVEK